jgi:hypothetical protein
MTSTKSVVVFGPQGCGKSRYAGAFREHFGLTEVVDDWSPGDDAPRTGALILTNADLTHQRARNDWRRVYSFNEALALIGGARDRKVPA